MKNNYDAHDYFSGNAAQTYTVHEADEIQETKLLGPDGKPYAIRRPKIKMGFDLSPTKR